MRYNLSLAFFILLHTCFAQTGSSGLSFYGVKNGLSNNSINKIIKDSQGFLWIGTSEGLNRFDGIHFMSFFKTVTDTNTLSGNTVTDILEYQPGHLLIGTNNGLSVLNTYSNSFENNKVFPALQKGSGIYIRSFFMDNQKHVYINYSGEIDVFDNNLAFLYRLTDKPWAKTLKGIIIYIEPWQQDSKGWIWLPSDNNGIYILDEKNKQVYSAANNPMHYSFFSEAPVRSFYYDENKKVIWYGFYGKGITKYNLETGIKNTEVFGLANGTEAGSINAITLKNEKLICCGSQGIYSMDTATMKYENIYYSSNEPSTSLLIHSHTLLHDEDNLWIGSETKGLIQLQFITSPVKQVHLPFPLKDFTNFCTAIVHSANGNLYFAYGFDGLVEVNAKKNNPVRYTFPSSKKKAQNIFRLCEDGRNRLWVGTNSGIFEFDKTTKLFTWPRWLPSFTRQLNVTYLFRDREGNVWVSFRNPNSLGFYDINTNRFYYYPHYIVDNKKILDDRFWVTRMTEDEKGNIWMISYQKAMLLCFEKQTGKWKNYLLPTALTKSIGDEGLNSICVTGNSIWLGNVTGLGLVNYDYHNDSMFRISRKDGLLSENIMAINKDNSGNLFLATESGINYLDHKTNEINSQAVNNEDVEWSFAKIQYYDGATNQFIYGLNDRIIFLQNNSTQPKTSSFITFIDKIKINSDSYAFNNNQQSISLAYFQKNISIDFASINYNKSITLQYASKMEGIDRDWNQNRQLTTANYSNLSPGEYTFMVKAKAQAGEWGPVTRLQIIITQVFWKTTWFLLLITGAALLLAFFLIRRRITNIRKGAELKQKLSETEMMALRSQMNPHFIFNCLNSIDNLIQNNEKEKATLYLSKFAKLIRSILETSKNNVVPCWKDMETLKLYLELEELRWDKKISYTISIADEILHGDYKVPPLVIQPFVENAIHHGLLNKIGSDRKLKIIVAVSSNKIYYTIEDNGVGRAKAASYKQLNKPAHESMGMQITTDRINLFNQSNLGGAVKISDLTDAGHQPAGTKVEVELINQS